MSASSAFHDTFGRDAFGDYGRPGGGASAGQQASRRTAPRRGPQAGAAAQAKQAPLRLTRRGRFVFFGVPLILLAALILSFSGFLNAPAKAADSADRALADAHRHRHGAAGGVPLGHRRGPWPRSAIPATSCADIVQLNNLDAARVDAGPAAVRSVQVASAPSNPPLRAVAGVTVSAPVAATT